MVDFARLLRQKNSQRVREAEEAAHEERMAQKREGNEVAMRAGLHPTQPAPYEVDEWLIKNMAAVLDRLDALVYSPPRQQQERPLTVSVKLTRRHNLGNYEHAEITVGLEAPVADGQSAEEVLSDVVGILRPFTALAVIEGAAPAVRPAARAVQAEISTNASQPAPAADPLASQPAPKTRAKRQPATDPLASGAAPTAAVTSDPLAAQSGAPASTVASSSPAAADPLASSAGASASASPAATVVGTAAPAPAATVATANTASPSDPLAAGGGGVKTSPQLIGEITTLIASDPVLNTAALDYLAKKEKARVRDLSDDDKIALLALLKSL